MKWSLRVVAVLLWAVMIATLLPRRPEDGIHAEAAGLMPRALETPPVRPAWELDAPAESSAGGNPADAPPIYRSSEWYAEEGPQDAYWFRDADGRDLRSKDVHISNPAPGGGRYRGVQPGRSSGTWGIDGSTRLTGRYGATRGGRQILVARGGGPIPEDPAVAVAAGLTWLARHQGPDGAWACGKFDQRCPAGKCAGVGYDDLDAGVTGLAVLAYLHAGYTPLSRAELADPWAGRVWRTRDVVSRGLRWLVSNQAPDGSLGRRDHDWATIQHASATWALCVASGLGADDAVRQSAMRAIDYLDSLQHPYSGWADGNREPADLVATAWAFRALAAAQDAGFTVRRSSLEGIAIQLSEARTSRSFGSLDVAYWKNAGKVVCQGKNDDWDSHPVGAAIALLALPRCGRAPALVDRLFANAIVSSLPVYGGKSIDYHAWNFAAAAMALRGREYPEHARAFRTAVRKALIPSQRVARDGCSRGSWDVDVDRWGFAGGRVFATAINVLTLLDSDE